MYSLGCYSGLAGVSKAASLVRLCSISVSFLSHIMFSVLFSKHRANPFVKEKCAHRDTEQTQATGSDRTDTCNKQITERPVPQTPDRRHEKEEKN